VPEIRITPAEGDADIVQSLEIHNAVHPRHPESLSGVREVERQSRAFAIFNAWLDGEPAGAAHVAVPGHTDTPGTDIYVLVERRGHGVGDALYRAVSGWAAARGAAELRASVTEGDDYSLGFATQRGFEEVSRDLLVELDLAAIQEPTVELPEGVEIVTWAERPEVTRGLYEVASEAMPDIPGADDDSVEPFERWLSTHMQGAGDEPRATFVALVGDEVVGYAKFSLWDAQPDTAFHDLTGVKRAWRGRGIARALKQTQIAWAKREGFARLQTTNEVRNEPIRRLNDEFGYKPIPGRIRLLGPAAPSR
jgi:GNAT superfamily N-acetyltransferase